MAAKARVTDIIPTTRMRPQNRNVDVVRHLVRMEKQMIYELRIYRCMPGRLPALLARFQNHTLGIWE
jgi:hypothetical protein